MSSSTPPSDTCSEPGAAASLGGWEAPEACEQHALPQRGPAAAYAQEPQQLGCCSTS
jgi:hypothetical protein